MTLFHNNAVETEHKTQGEATEPGQATQETALPDVETVVRLFSDRRLRTRKGAIVWLWTALTPLVAWLALNTYAGNNLDWAYVAFFLATTLTLHRLTASLDRTNVVLQTNLDKRWISALIDALEWPNRRIRAIAGWYLIRLLPTLTEEDAALLGDAQRASLYSRLTPLMANRNPALTLAILKALEHIGDGEAIPYVTRLARLIAFGSRAGSVQQAARVCLPILERRVLKQRLAAAESEAPISLPVASEPSLTPEQKQIEAHVEERLKALEAECRKTQPGMRWGFLLASWGVIFPYMAFQAYSGLIHRNWLQTLLFGSLALGTTQLHRLTLTAKHRAMARFLAEMDNVQAVGRLAEMLDWPEIYMRRVAIEALTKLLPLLRASDSALLNRKQRNTLYRMLTMANARTHSKFLVTLLKALEQVGDETALLCVENLLKTPPHTSQQQKVYEAARDCLPYIREQAKQEHYSQTLLRATTVNNLPPETLLRPASNPPDMETATLLRVDTAENTGTP